MHFSLFTVYGSWFMYSLLFEYYDSSIRFSDKRKNIPNFWCCLVAFFYSQKPYNTAKNRIRYQQECGNKNIFTKLICFG